jgi:hypothetical protein
MTGPGNESGSGAPKSGGMLRQGFWNYAMDRWASKNPTGRLIFEMGILIGFFLLLAVLAMLAQG